MAAVTVRVAATPTTPRADKVLRSGSQTVGIITRDASSMYVAESGAKRGPSSWNRLSPCTKSGQWHSSTTQTLPGADRELPARQRFPILRSSPAPRPASSEGMLHPQHWKHWTQGISARAAEMSQQQHAHLSFPLTMNAPQPLVHVQDPADIKVSEQSRAQRAVTN